MQKSNIKKNRSAKLVKSSPSCRRRVSLKLKEASCVSKDRIKHRSIEIYLSLSDVLSLNVLCKSRYKNIIYKRKIVININARVSFFILKIFIFLISKEKFFVIYKNMLMQRKHLI